MILLKNLWQKDGVGLTEEDRSANSMGGSRFGRYDDRKTDLRPTLTPNIKLAKGSVDYSLYRGHVHSDKMYI